jgi:hypothetical protein
MVSYYASLGADFHWAVEGIAAALFGWFIVSEAILFNLKDKLNEGD